MKKVHSKKILSLAMAVLFGTCVFAVPVFAENANDTVYVTISDAQGNLVLAQEPIMLSDTDGDGALTIHDALYAAHEAKYDGGADVGYGSEYGAYGFSLTKLWGTENGGSYRYSVNNIGATNLADTVKNGDYINAYIYTDLVSWSDTFCFFDVNTVSTAKGEEITLTLTAEGYDENWNTITYPVEGATILLNGKPASYKTDANGKVMLSFDQAGTYVISASSEAQTLFPPVCKAQVAADSNPAVMIVCVVAAVIVIAGAAAWIVMKRKKA